MLLANHDKDAISLGSSAQTAMFLPVGCLLLNQPLKYLITASEIFGDALLDLYEINSQDDLGMQLCRYSIPFVVPWYGADFR